MSQKTLVTVAFGDVVKMETLRTSDGKPEFSLAQGQ
jgi:hypothetical protein